MPTPSQPRPDGNIDHETVAGFGEEWSAFDQSRLDGEDYENEFDGYFEIFPFDSLPRDCEGFDLGCGSGRWAKRVATKVGQLHCIDPSSQALE
ncbi:MAG: class I SAM-dependent methyltransferase, partial [Sphingomicrobium sp.]